MDEFDKFCDIAEPPTMSHFSTKLACMAARERYFFAAGQASERAACAQLIADRLYNGCMIGGAVLIRDRGNKNE